MELTKYDWLKSRQIEIIKQDPILNWVFSLDSINDDFAEVYKAISHKPIIEGALTKFPILQKLFKNNDIQSKVASFEWKLSWIDIAFKTNYNALIASSELYDSFIEESNNVLEEIKSEQSTIDIKDTEGKIEFNALEQKRLALANSIWIMKTNNDSIKRIKKEMETQKPVLDFTINWLIIVKTWEQAMNIAQKSVSTLKEFTAKALKESTDSAIAMNKEVYKDMFNFKTLESYKQNILKLHSSIEEIKNIKIKSIEEFNTKYNIDSNIKIQWSKDNG